MKKISKITEISKAADSYIPMLNTIKNKEN